VLIVLLLLDGVGSGVGSGVGGVVGSGVGSGVGGVGGAGIRRGETVGAGLLGELLGELLGREGGSTSHVPALHQPSVKYPLTREKQEGRGRVMRSCCAPCRVRAPCGCCRVHRRPLPRPLSAPTNSHNRSPIRRPTNAISPPPLLTPSHALHELSTMPPPSSTLDAHCSRRAERIVASAVASATGAAVAITRAGALLTARDMGDINGAPSSLLSLSLSRCLQGRK
jgi:hypothetical protein